MFKERKTIVPLLKETRKLILDKSKDQGFWVDQYQKLALDFISLNMSTKRSKMYSEERVLNYVYR